MGAVVVEPGVGIDEVDAVVATKVQYQVEDQEGAEEIKAMRGVGKALKAGTQVTVVADAVEEWWGKAMHMKRLDKMG